METPLGQTVNFRRRDHAVVHCVLPCSAETGEAVVKQFLEPASTMKTQTNRRTFLKRAAVAAAGLGLTSVMRSSFAAETKQPLFKISLAEWSYNRAIFGKKMDHLDFPKVAKQDHGIEAIELVNQFFMKRAKDQKYLAEFKR